MAFRHLPDEHSGTGAGDGVTADVSVVVMRMRDWWRAEMRPRACRHCAGWTARVSDQRGRAPPEQGQGQGQRQGSARAFSIADAYPTLRAGVLSSSCQAARAQELGDELGNIGDLCAGTGASALPATDSCGRGRAIGWHVLRMLGMVRPASTSTAAAAVTAGGGGAAAAAAAASTNAETNVGGKTGLSAEAAHMRVQEVVQTMIMIWCLYTGMPVTVAAAATTAMAATARSMEGRTHWLKSMPWWRCFAARVLVLVLVQVWVLVTVTVMAMPIAMAPERRPAMPCCAALSKKSWS